MAKPIRGEFEVELAGQKYLLRLGIGEIEEIEEATGLAAFELLKLFQAGSAKVKQARAVLGQAITQDGKKIDANRIRRLVEKAGIFDSMKACLAVLTTVYIDVEPPGNAEAVADAQAPAAA